jgi:hypothetical protein
MTAGYRRRRQGIKPKRRQAARARVKARERGLLYYRSKTSCSRGHRRPLRLTSTGACVECQRQKYSRMTEAKRESARRQARSYSKRCTRALAVLHHLGIPI